MTLPPPAFPPRRPRLKTVLIGSAGAALVLLPLGQVLRYQGTELQALAVERAALDPFAQGVGAQRRLLAHREVADLVLRGRRGLESERQQRQLELSEQLLRLQDTLAAGWWMRALQESQSLATNWQDLTRRIAARQIKPQQNLDQHGMLMDQVIQVMDLAQALAPRDTSPATAELTRLARATMQAAANGADPQQLAAFEQALLAVQLQQQQREGQLHEQRAGVLLALGALLAALLVAVMLPLAPPRQPGGAPAGGARQGHGRRSTDQAPATTVAGQLLDDLRGGQARHRTEAR